MAYELVYTSVPRGLKLGRTGFCTVAMTSGMPAPLVQTLESMTGYKALYTQNDARYASNPPAFFHYSVKVAGKYYDICGRICSCALDYTGRSNKIAHFIVPDEAEKQQMPWGAASLSEELFRTGWSGEPQEIAARLKLKMNNFTPGVASEWKRMAGDAGWAGVLAQSFLDKPRERFFILFDPDRPVNCLQLVREAVQLLPPERRWEVSYNTCVSNAPIGVISNWNFCPKNNDFMQSASVIPSKVLVDLTAPAAIPAVTVLVQAARSGEVPAAATPQGSPVQKNSPVESTPMPNASVPLEVQQWTGRARPGRVPMPFAGEGGFPVGSRGVDSNAGKGARRLCWVLAGLAVFLFSLAIGFGGLYYQTRMELRRYASKQGEAEPREEDGDGEAASSAEDPEEDGDGEAASSEEDPEEAQARQRRLEELKEQFANLREKLGPYFESDPKFRDAFGALEEGLQEDEEKLRCFAAMLDACLTLLDEKQKSLNEMDFNLSDEQNTSTNIQDDTESEGLKNFNEPEINWASSEVVMAQRSMQPPQPATAPAATEQPPQQSQQPPPPQPQQSQQPSPPQQSQQPPQPQYQPPQPQYQPPQPQYQPPQPQYQPPQPQYQPPQYQPPQPQYQPPLRPFQQQPAPSSPIPSGKGKGKGMGKKGKKKS